MSDYYNSKLGKYLESEVLEKFIRNLVNYLKTEKSQHFLKLVHDHYKCDFVFLFIDEPKFNKSHVVSYPKLKRNFLENREEVSNIIGFQPKFYHEVPLKVFNDIEVGRIAIVFKEKSDNTVFNDDEKNWLTDFSKVIVDLFDFKLKKNELEVMRSQYEDVQSMSQTGGWELDLKTGKTYWSKQIYDIHGLPYGASPEKVDAITFFAKHERERLYVLLDRCALNGEAFDEEFEFIDNHGKHKWVRSISRPVYNDDGVIIKLIGTFQDITEKKETEILLKFEKQHKDLALEGSGLGIWDWDLRDNSVRFDHRWASMLGLDVNKIEMALATWEDRVHPDDIENCYKDIKKYMNGEVDRYENIHRMKHSDGHWVYILDRGRFSDWDEDGRPIRFTGTHFDITESKHREFQLDFVLNNLDVGIWKYYPESQVLEWDDSMYALYGVNKDDFSGAYDAWEQTLSPDYKDSAVKELADALASGDEFHSCFKIISAPGEYKYIAAQAVIERDVDGKPVLMTGINWDVTKEQEINILNKEILNSTTDGIILVNHLNRKLEVFNRRFQKMWKIPDELVETRDSNKIVQFALEQLKDPTDFTSVVESLYSSPEKESFDILEFKDGRVFERVSTPLKVNESYHGRIWFFRDVTEKREMEQAVHHKSKLAAIGQLAAGVGHEINNPLTIIKGFTQSILSNANIDDLKVIKKLNKMIVASDRIANIVAGLRVFARQDQGQKEETFTVDQLLHDMHEMLKDIYLQSGVELKLDFLSGSEKLSIFGDRGKLEQVLLNLIGNAKDATDGLSHRHIKVVSTVSTLGLLEIHVVDNGKGISVENRDKIFNPFFTTKEVGKGTGIGLSLSHKIITDSFNGTLSFKNNDSSDGVTFKISLPIEEHVKAEDSNSTKIVSEQIKSEFSLNAIIAEDEVDIREILEDMFIKIGIKVKVFENGLEALKSFKQDPDWCDLIVSDVKMPIMDGLTFLKEVRSEKSLKQPKFFISTGGVDTDFEKHQFRDFIDGYFYKPIASDQILQILSEHYKQLKKQVA